MSLIYNELLLLMFFVHLTLLNWQGKANILTLSYKITP